MQRLKMNPACFVLVTSCVLNFSIYSQSFAQPIVDQPGNVPEFRNDLDWLNTDHPLSIKDFQGKFILLEFWNYGDINSLQIIPDLKSLAEKYSSELVVIGVHSAKFPAEQDTQNIREAILQRGIDYPVVNDRQLLIWKDYGVHSLPTVILIDPFGNIIGRKPGVNIYTAIDQVMNRAIKRFETALDRKPVSFALEKFPDHSSTLYFPGKIIADLTNNQLFISDSGHHQILQVGFDGRILEVIGTGEPGQLNGAFNEAQFCNPQGLALDGPILYVADADNHLIRRVDLESQTVQTIAGIGIHGNAKDPHGRNDRVALNSPNDLTIVDGWLYITMTGDNQIWKMNLQNQLLFLHAGSGFEDRKDAVNRAAALAQPAGLATDGEKLYFTDSQVSSVRSSDLKPRGQVQSLVGRGLFEFGDREGDFQTARLQHPLGMIYHNNLLYIADTYNNKIKVVDPVHAAVRNFAGSGKAGYLDGNLADSQFNEPNGLACLRDFLYVADTNNHVIRTIDLKNGTVATFQLQPKSSGTFLDSLNLPNYLKN